MKEKLKPKIFKNKVGRPSNEILNKRKKIIITGFITIFVLIGVAFYLGLKVFKPIQGIAKNSTNTKSSEMHLKLGTQSTTRSLVIGTKKYKNGVWVNQDQIGNQTLFVSNDGKTKLKVKLYISKEFFNKVKDYAESTHQNLAFGIATYDSKLNIINSSGFTQVKEQYFTEENGNYVVNGVVTINSKVKYVMASAMNMTTGQHPFYIKLNAAVFPTIEIKPKTGKVDSKGIVTVNKLQQYNSTVTIKNPSKVRLYYRWIKYTNHTMTNPTVQECKYTDKSVKTLVKGLYIKSDYPQRTGYLRIYTSEKACKNDSKVASISSSGNTETRPYLVSGNIKYALAKTYNAGSNWIRLSFDYNDLKKKIGNQIVNNDRNICFNYALSYGTYIINGNGTYTKPLTNISANYGAKKYSYSNAYDLYKKIKNKIDGGIPVSLHVSHSGGQHWVLVTGYKKGGSSYNIKNGSNLRKYLYVLDPWDSQHQAMNNETLATSLHSDMDYITW